MIGRGLGEELRNFFDCGLEPVESSLVQLPEPVSRE